MIRKLQPRDLTADLKAGGRRQNQALQSLMKRNFPKVKALIRRMGGEEADAEDVFQEGVTALMLNLQKGAFKGDSSIDTYLYAICRGIWLKMLRKHGREVSSDGMQLPEAASGIGADHELLAEDRRRHLIELFDRLGSKCRELLFLWAQHFSMQEIATKLEYSSPQVAMNKKSRCMSELHGILDAESGALNLLKQV